MGAPAGLAFILKGSLSRPSTYAFFTSRRASTTQKGRAAQHAWLHTVFTWLAKAAVGG
jgi:hypothetical protein